MSMIIVVSSQHFCLMLGDRRSTKVYGYGNLLPQDITKVFKLSPHLFACANGPYEIYFSALNQLAYMINDPLFTKNDNNPDQPINLYEKVTNFLNNLLISELEKYSKLWNTPINKIPVIRVALVSTGEFVNTTGNDIAHRHFITIFRSEQNFQPQLSPGIIDAYDPPLSTLACRIWEDEISKQIRIQGALAQAQLLRSIHALCSTLSMWIASEYDLILIGENEYQVLNGRVFSLPIKDIYTGL